jgi:hypothetical protein
MKEITTSMRHRSIAVFLVSRNVNDICRRDRDRERHGLWFASMGDVGGVSMHGGCGGRTGGFEYADRSGDDCGDSVMRGSFS